MAFGLKMTGSIAIEDKRLTIALGLGYLLVLIYALLNVFYHAEYFQYLPVAPVSQGGYVADDLPYDPTAACTVAQNAHCPEHSGDATDLPCIVATPDDIVLGGTVFQDQLYITTKLEVLTHIKTCTGEVSQDICVGIASETESARLSLHTAGLEGLAVVNSHASKDPHSKEEGKTSSTHHHCELKGSMEVKPIAAGPCVDATSSVLFSSGRGDDGTCYEGDRMTVGQLLQNVDMFDSESDTLLGSNGEITQEVRETGAAVHVKIIYSNSPSDKTIKYRYEGQVIDRDPFVTARRELVKVDEWVRQSDRLWTREETVLLRHGIVFTFSQVRMILYNNSRT